MQFVLLSLSHRQFRGYEVGGKYQILYIFSFSNIINTSCWFVGSVGRTEGLGFDWCHVRAEDDESHLSTKSHRDWSWPYGLKMTRQMVCTLVSIMMKMRYCLNRDLILSVYMLDFFLALLQYKRARFTILWYPIAFVDNQEAILYQKKKKT